MGQHENKAGAVLLCEWDLYTSRAQWVNSQQYVNVSKPTGPILVDRNLLLIFWLWTWTCFCPECGAPLAALRGSPDVSPGWSFVRRAGQAGSNTVAPPLPPGKQHGTRQTSSRATVSTARETNGRVLLKRPNWRSEIQKKLDEFGTLTVDSEKLRRSWKLRKTLNHYFVLLFRLNWAGPALPSSTLTSLLTLDKSASELLHFSSIAARVQRARLK